MRTLLNPVTGTATSLLIFLLFPLSATAQQDTMKGTTISIGQGNGSGPKISIKGPGGIQIGPDGMTGGAGIMGLFKKVDDADNFQVQISPATIDPKTHTAVVTLYNPSSDTMSVALSLRSARPDVSAGVSSNAMGNGTAQAAPAASADTTHSLVSWVTGLPKSVLLPPNARQQITLKATIPAQLYPGNYVGWIVGLTSDPPTGSDDDKAGGVPPAVTVARLMYRAK